MATAHQRARHQARLVNDAATPVREGWKPMRLQEFSEFIGPFLYRREGEGYRYAFQADQRHVNINGVLHGGMLMTFIDQAMGSAVFEAVGRRKCATAQLNTHFMGPVKPGDFVECDSDVMRVTRSLVFMRGILRVGDRPVLAADGVWKILGTP